MRYAIIIEKTDNNYGAWAPDFPGCVAVGDTVEDGDPIPPPTVQVNYVDVAA